MSRPIDLDSNVLRIAVLGGSDAMAGEASNSLAGRTEDPDRRLIFRGNNDSSDLISDESAWSLCYVGPNYFRQARRWDLSRFSVIVNLISDPDQNPKTLRIAERITGRYRDRLINDPSHILKTRRDDIARMLEGTRHLHVPKVLRLRAPTLARLRTRIDKEEFRFPAIVRAVGTQSGKIVGLFQKPEELGDHFAGMKGEYYFIEFVDCRWSDGLVRKMRFYSIGGEVFLDHMFISDNWSIHGASARSGIMFDREDLRAEERRYLEGGVEVTVDRGKDMVKEVARRIRLDYFGVDCGFTEDGRFVLFEANATMNIMTRTTDPRYAYAQKRGIEPGKAAFHSLLHRKAASPHKA